MEFERGWIIRFQREEFSYLSIPARAQRNSSTVMRALKKWRDEQWIFRKTDKERPKVTSVHDDRHLLHMAVYPATFRQLAELRSTATSVLMSVSSIRRRLLSVAPSTACKGAFLQKTSNGKQSTAASAMGSWAQILASCLTPNCLFRWMKLQFVVPRWPDSCETLCR